MHDRLIDTEALRRRLAERDLSLRELSARSHVSYSHLRHVLGGTRQLSDRAAFRVAAALAVSVEAFSYPKEPHTETNTNRGGAAA